MQPVLFYVVRLVLFICDRHPLHNLILIVLFFTSVCLGLKFYLYYSRQLVALFKQKMSSKHRPKHFCSDNNNPSPSPQHNLRFSLNKCNLWVYYANFKGCYIQDISQDAAVISTDHHLFIQVL